LNGSEIQAKANSQRLSDAAAPLPILSLVSRPGAVIGGTSQKTQFDRAHAKERRNDERPALSAALVCSKSSIRRRHERRRCCLSARRSGNHLYLFLFRL